MKKIIVFFMTLVLVFIVTGCSKKPTAKIENEDIRRSSYKFDLSVDDKDMVTKGSVLVNFYKVADKEESLVSTKTLTTFSETVSVSGLESNTDYRCDVLCTYNKKSHIIYTWFIKTNEAGTEFDPVEIKTANEFVDCITNDYSSDVYYKLANDIDFSEYKDEEGKAKEFSGVSTTSSTAFAGHFDGAGYTIKNVTVTSSSTYNGIFGYLKGVVENVNFENIKVNVTRDSSTTTYIGSICGYGYQAQLINVKVDGIDITVDAKTQYTGGVIGYAFATNTNNVKVTNLAIDTKNATKAYVGGITSYLCQNSSSKYGKLYDSTVKGTIKTTNVSALYYGGLVGLLKAGSEINKCISDISADIKAYGEVKAGGLVGQANLNSVDYKGYIKNVVSKGNITFKTYKDAELKEDSNDVIVGGLIGSATSVITSSAYIEMELNVEAKMASEKNLYVGLVFGNGHEYHTTLSNSIINGSIVAATAESDAEAKINIHGYDGSSFIEAGDEKPLSSIDSETVGYVNLDIKVDGTDSSYPTPIELADASTKAAWDMNIFNVEVRGNSISISFK